MNEDTTTFALSPEHMEKENKMREIRNKSWADATDNEKIEKLKIVYEQMEHFNRSITILQREFISSKSIRIREMGQWIEKFEKLKNYVENF